MRDTTCSVPDAASRGRDCAAPSQSSEIQNSVTSVSELCPACHRLDRFCICDEDSVRSGRGPTPLRTPNQAREYLVEQLVITARHLADSHIFRETPDLPFCTKCCTSGLNNRPIQHLPSCTVGNVLRAIGDLR